MHHGTDGQLPSDPGSSTGPAAGPIFIGVAGGSGSGKTTVVQEIVRGLGSGRVTVIHHDSYYRDRSGIPPEEREAINYDHPDALETHLLIEHLKQLRRGSAVQVPVYDFSTHTRRPDATRVDPAQVVLIDGILILSDAELRKLLDIKVFVDTDADVRLMRRLSRDLLERGRSVDSVLDQYGRMVRPMHLEFVEPSKRYADLIIPEGGHNRVAVDMLVVRIRSILENRG